MKYAITLERLRADRTPEAVAPRVAAIFGVDYPAGLDIAKRLGQPARRELDGATARAMKQQLEPLGFVVRIVPSGPPPPPRFGPDLGSLDPATLAEPSVLDLELDSSTMGFGTGVDGVGFNASTLAVPADNALDSSTRAYGPGLEAKARRASSPGESRPGARPSAAISTAGALASPASSPAPWTASANDDVGIDFAWSGLEDMPSLDVAPGEPSSDALVQSTSQLELPPPRALDALELDLPPATVAAVGLAEYTVKAGPAGSYGRPGEPAAEPPAAPPAPYSNPYPNPYTAAPPTIARRPTPTGGVPCRAGGELLGDAVPQLGPPPQPFLTELMLAWVFPVVGGLQRVLVAATAIGVLTLVAGFVFMSGAALFSGRAAQMAGVLAVGFTILVGGGLSFAWFFRVVQISGWSDDDLTAITDIDLLSIVGATARYIAVFVMAGAPSALVTWQLTGGAARSLGVLASLIGLAYLPGGFAVAAAEDNFFRGIFNPLAVLRLVQRAPVDYAFTVIGLILWSAIFGVVTGLALPLVAVLAALIPVLGALLAAVLFATLSLSALTVGARMVGRLVRHHLEVFEHD